MSLTKKIKNEEDMKEFQRSEIFNKILLFIRKISDAIQRDSKSPLKIKIMDNIEACFNLLDEWMDECPPVTQESRYGNIAFRQWHQKLSNNMAILISSLFGQNGGKLNDESKGELMSYFLDSFGNTQRLDYGTGHELNFLLFLLAIQESFECSISAHVLPVLKRYLSLVRRIQSVYLLEPAGSKGAWGLDDYQFLPFVFGAAQLKGKEDEVSPAYVSDPKKVKSFAEKYIYFSCISFITKMKNGPFFEHSTTLYNISGIESWAKIHEGLIKMYKGEVLSALPVAQHIKFGQILSFKSD